MYSSFIELIFSLLADDEAALMKQWLALVNERNGLVRRNAELSVLYVMEGRGMVEMGGAYLTRSWRERGWRWVELTLQSHGWEREGGDGWSLPTRSWREGGDGWSLPYKVMEEGGDGWSLPYRGEREGGDGWS